MRILNPSLPLILVGLVVIASGQAMAQSGSYGISKPFSNYQPRPTVSPYINLFRDLDSGSGVYDYQTLVRPYLRQQKTNTRQRMLNQRQRDLNLQQQRSGQGQRSRLKM